MEDSTLEALRLHRQRPRFIALLHASRNSQCLVKTVVQRLQQFGETTSVFTDESENLAGIAESVQSIFDENRELLAFEDIRRWVAEARECDRVFLNLDVARAELLLSLLGETCDRVYWFVTVAEAECMVRQVAKIAATGSGLVDHMRWVWCLDGPHAVAPRTPQISGFAGRDFKLRLPGSDQASCPSIASICRASLLLSAATAWLLWMRASSIMCQRMCW